MLDDETTRGGDEGEDRSRDDSDDSEEPLERNPGDGVMPSDPGVQAERQEEGVEAEWEHE